MSLDEMTGKYRHLRQELDAAYSSPVWDSQRIDHIAEQMITLESELGSLSTDVQVPHIQST